MWGSICFFSFSFLLMPFFQKQSKQGEPDHPAGGDKTRVAAVCIWASLSLLWFGHVWLCIRLPPNSTFKMEVVLATVVEKIWTHSTLSWMAMFWKTAWHKVGTLLVIIKWSHNPYKWHYRWVTGVMILLIVPFITARDLLFQALMCAIY